MRTLPLILTGALASALLAGCETLRPGPKPADAPRADVAAKCEKKEPVCHIDVKVKDCKVTVTPDEKRVASRPEGVAMQWTIRGSPGVRFAYDGIVFDKRTRVFTVERGALAGDTFTMFNTTEPGKYKYSVNVVDNGKACPSHDPIIVNDP